MGTGVTTDATFLHSGSMCYHGGLRVNLNSNRTDPLHQPLVTLSYADSGSTLMARPDFLQYPLPTTQPIVIGLFDLIYKISLVVRISIFSSQFFFKNFHLIKILDISKLLSNNTSFKIYEDKGKSLITSRPTLQHKGS